MTLEIATYRGEVVLRFADDAGPVVEFPLTVDETKLLVNDLGGAVHYLTAEEARAR